LAPAGPSSSGSGVNLVGHDCAEPGLVPAAVNHEPWVTAVMCGRGVSPSPDLSPSLRTNAESANQDALDSTGARSEGTGNARAFSPLIANSCLAAGADKFKEGIVSAEELGNYLFHEVPIYSPRRKCLNTKASAMPH
jgi:hypothetical protein